MQVGVAAARDGILRQWHDVVGPEATRTDNVHTLTFAAAHLHPLAYAWIDRHHRANPTVWAATHYGYLLVATLVIRARPRHRRLLGVLTTVGGVALDRALGPSSAAPWFGPVFYAKLLLGHASAARWSDAELAAAPDLGAIR